MLIIRETLQKADTDLQALHAQLGNGAHVLRTQLAAARASYKEMNSTFRKLALERMERGHIAASRGPGVCWRLLRKLSKPDVSSNIPPADLINHFKTVYYNQSHPALLRYWHLSMLILRPISLFRFCCRCLFSISLITVYNYLPLY